MDNAADTATTIESTTMTATMKLLPMPPGLGATEGELERLVRSSLSSCILLENYPRCVIRVIVLVVQASKTVLGSAVNCAVLALLDAGVAMGDDDDGVLAGSRRGGGPIYSFTKE